MKPFYYKIAGYTYTLDEVKHGLLRLNKRPPGSIFRVINQEDPRLLAIQQVGSPRGSVQQPYQSKINFVCCDFPTICDQIEVIYGATEQELNASLDNFVRA